MADRRLGVAFFDKIRIDADRITDPRWDRVLPILAEEQVFMCRAMKMRKLLSPGLQVLDVGTGSGVFAIWAAAHGCHVQALDCSPRSLRFTRHNLHHQQNADLIDKEKGKVKPFLADFKDYAKETEDRFDIIFLASPYNPTAPGIMPAQHAAAGPLGQDLFYEQLPLALKLLQPGGKIIGNHMAFHQKGQSAEWWKETISQYAEGKKFYLSYTPILKEPEYVAREFLQQQYVNFLEPTLSLNPSRDAIQDYITSQTSDSKSVFGLYYFEIEVPDQSISRKLSVEIERIGLAIHPPATWQDRINLHRIIVEHTSRQNSIPSPALFLENDCSPPLPKFIAEEEQDLFKYKGLKDIFSSSPLSSILKWINQTHLIGSEKLFDLVVIDIGPWFDTWEGRRAIRNEALLCMQKDFNDSDPCELLNQYQLNTKTQQISRLGPFLHPHFTGASSPTEWIGVQFQVLDSNDDNLKSLSENEQKKISEWLENQDKQFSELVQNNHEKNEELDNVTPRDIRVAYASESLDDLGVPDPTDYAKRILETFNRDNLNEITQQEFGRDLELVHMTFHCRLRKLLIGRPNGNYEGEQRTSALIGVPLSLGYSTQKAEDAIIPSTYRGGFWIFVVSRNQIGPKEESMLFDLSRLSSILINSSVTIRANSSAMNSLRLSYQSSLVHEIRSLISSIRSNTSSEHLDILRGYFRMMAISVNEFKTNNPYQDWQGLKRVCRPGFTEGDTLEEFISNHWFIAREIESIQISINQKDTEAVKAVPSLDIQQPELKLTGYISSTVSGAFRKNIIQRVFLGLSLIATFRNIMQHANEKEALKINVQDGMLEMVNIRLFPDEEVIKSGTEKVLRHCISVYMEKTDYLFRFEPLFSDNNYWSTCLPLPPGLLQYN